MMMNSFSGKDQMGYEVKIKEAPRRIISLVPSQTELLFDLGLDEAVVGITKFCVHPKEECKAKAKIGGTKKFNFDLIDKLSPDLIIGNKEENYKEGIEQLKKRWPVWMSDIQTFEESLEMMKSVGKITGRAGEAEILTQRISKEFKRLDFKENLSALYLIWKNPYMSVGKDTFIHDMMKRCGFKNVLGEKERYPILTKEEVTALDPDIILLSSEPFPFKEKHVPEFRKLFPNADVAIVDGEMFSWYGSRLKYAPAYFEYIREQLAVANRN